MIGPGGSVNDLVYPLPVILHVPTNVCTMDPIRIAEFLESTYPQPTLSRASELGINIEAQARIVFSKVFSMSVMPRENALPSPRSQEYFRTTRERDTGHRLEDRRNSEKEEEGWNELDEGMRAVSDLILSNKGNGRFVLGARPSYVDFYIAGNTHSARMVHEGTFRRIVEYPGFKEVYEACWDYIGEEGSSPLA